MSSAQLPFAFRNRSAVLIRFTQVFYGPRSLVFRESNNRKWTIMALFECVLLSRIRVYERLISRCRSLLFGHWSIPSSPRMLHPRKTPQVDANDEISSSLQPGPAQLPKTLEKDDFYSLMSQ